MTWNERTVRANPRRLRNAREAVAELALVLDELEAMDEDERRAAQDHHGHAVGLVERIGEELGPTGPDPEKRERRIARAVREAMTTTNGRGR